MADETKTVAMAELDPQFKYDVSNEPGGENIKVCFACGTCTATCPVSVVDDEYNPRRIIRQVLLGMRDAVLSSPVIWRCETCYACTAKCPQGVNFGDVMRALRDIAVREGKVSADLPAKMRELDQLAHKLRRDMAKCLVEQPDNYKAMRAAVESQLLDE